MKTYYDVLDAVRRFPGIHLGGVDSESIAGTRMPRLLAFLTGLHFAKLDPGDPPFHDFGPWFSVRFEGISDSNNLPFHWLEERERGQDSAFEIFFSLLDEYRSCHAVPLEQSRGPFHPSFTVGEGRQPDHPDAIVVGRFAPSDVFFWEERFGAETRRHSRFFRSLSAARREASAHWGVRAANWSAP